MEPNGVPVLCFRILQDTSVCVRMLLSMMVLTSAGTRGLTAPHAPPLDRLPLLWPAVLPWPVLLQVTQIPPTFPGTSAHSPSLCPLVKCSVAPGASLLWEAFSQLELGIYFSVCYYVPDLLVCKWR